MSPIATRKIQKSKSGSFLVSLPKPWVEDLGLKKGEEVEMQIEDAGSLKIRFPGKEIKPKYSLKMKNFPDLNSLKNAVRACYMQGAETIEVSSEQNTITKEKKSLRPVILDLIGAEILEDYPSKISLRVIVDPTKFSIHDLVERIYGLIDSVQTNILQALKEKDYALASDASHRGEDVDRLYRLMIRQLRLAIDDDRIAQSIDIKGKEEILFYAITARDLTRLAYHAVEVAKISAEKGKIFKKEDIEYTIDMFKTIEKMEQKAIEALEKNNLQIANEVFNLFNELRKKDEEITEKILEKEMKEDRAHALNSISRNLRRMAGYTVALADNATTKGIAKYRQKNHQKKEGKK